MPVAPFVRTQFDNEDKIGEIQSPLLIIHSSEDSLIPIHHGRGLFEAAIEPKVFVKAKGDHNQVLSQSAQNYKEALANFLDSTLGPQ